MGKEFKVAVQSGNGQYYKSIEDLYVDGMTLSAMVEKINSLQAYCERLERLIAEKDAECKKYQSVNDQTIDLLTKGIDLANKQLASIRFDLDDND